MRGRGPPPKGAALKTKEPTINPKVQYNEANFYFHTSAAAEYRKLRMRAEIQGLRVAAEEYRMMERKHNHFADEYQDKLAKGRS